MATRTSQLIVELLDRVSAPARRASEALRGIGRAVSTPGAMTERMNGAIARNEAALDRARAGALDAVGAYYALSSAIGAPVRAAMEFESAMADVKKVVNFDGAEDIKAFEQGLMDMTKRVPMAVNGLAEIAAAAGQSGIAKEDILSFTEAAAQIGVAFDISADEAGTSMAKLMTGLGLTLDEAKLLTDAMNHLSNSQASSAAEVLDVVRRVGAQGKQYGFAAEEVAAFGSAMISAGAQTDVAATSFMNMGRALTRGASATMRQKEAYKALGMDAEKVAAAMQKDATKTTVTVMEAIAALPKEMQAAISSDLFGDEARALGPLLTNLDLVRESLGLIGDESKYAGSATKEFATRAKTFQNRMQLFNNSMTRLKVTLGTALLPILTDLMNRLEPIIDKIGEWISANPELVGQIISAVAALVAFKGALAAIRFVGLLGNGGALNLLALGMGTVGRAAAHLWGAARASVALQAALGAMSGGQALGVISKLGVGLRGAIMAVPGIAMLGQALGAIGAAVAGIGAGTLAAFAAVAAAVGAAGFAIWKYWDRVSSVFSGVSARVSEELQPAFDAVRPVLDWLQPIGDLIASAWERVGQAFDIVKSAVTSIDFGGLFSQEVLTPEQIANGEKKGYQLADRIITGIKAPFLKLEELKGMVLTLGGEILQSLWDGMVARFSEFMAWVQEIPARIVEAIGNIDLSGVIKWPSMPSWLGGGEAAAASAGPSVDGARAKGGPISRGGTYLAGEKGPELITPTRSGYVHTAAKTAAMGAGATINLGGISIHGAPEMDAHEIAAEAVRQIEAKIGAALRGVQADTGMEAYG